MEGVEIEMDKTWIMLDDRRLTQYEEGVRQFLDFAYSSKEKGETIRCPCKKCNNVLFQNRNNVEDHIFKYGFIKSYVIWVLHGEEYSDSDEDGRMADDEFGETIGDMGGQNFVDIQSMLEDVHASTRSTVFAKGSTSDENSMPKFESKTFLKLLKDADKELYPGCKSFSKLSFVVTLMHIKIISRWSNKSFSMLLEVLKKALPDGESLPSSYYEAKTIIQGLGLNYEKVHACVNDCVLFRKKHENDEECPNCLEPRYKFVDVAKDKKDGKTRKKVPQKVLRYFPLKPRLQKLFMFKKTAEDMRWHKEKRTDDGVLKHPADAQEWKDFDKRYESFGQEPRNVRLGLASDGFNPFSNMSLTHSTWPVILLPYNLPPWKCLKAPFFILSMLIPGPKSPGNDIDIF
ncbi:uncharacterized protein LOC131011035 [Salvia miltiorrhiza]|uniref:uncharacterized protein LOC131011035 n=1 Tax=Salvia miltiorrhiza TaxID=226208 RepID=UPI0025AD0A9B|nr:uncharacterized protein LOC131011035 [Salvia miltiorrhiza]